MPRTMNLVRLSTTIDGTFGVLINALIPFAITLERQWLNNQRGISCIPDGEYDCVRVQSPRFGDTFEVKDVPERSHILFHKGNLKDDSHGCILIGEQYEQLDGKPAVLASRKGYNEFKKLLTDEHRFVLRILWYKDHILKSYRTYKGILADDTG